MRGNALLTAFFVFLFIGACTASSDPDRDLNRKGESASNNDPSPIEVVNPAKDPALLSVEGVEQTVDPVKWSTKLVHLSGQEYELQFIADIDDTWHIYSQKMPGDNGPLPVEFTFEKLDNVEKVGKVTEPEPHVQYSEAFEMDVLTFEHHVVLKQKVKLNGNKGFVKGDIYFMACTKSMCLAPSYYDFQFDIVGKEEASTTPEQNDASTTSEGDGEGSDDDPEGGDDTAEPAETADSKTTTTPSSEGTTTSHSSSGSQFGKDYTKTDPERDYTDISYLEPGFGDDIGDDATQSIWGIFIGGLIGGLLALLTPCVFPMIPLTVSFFTKQSKTKQKGIMNASIYAISIMVIYVGLGFAITKIFGPDTLNAMASNGIFNTIFFLVFIIFAMSFFGAFEITLPSSWINKTDAAADKGGLMGIFFMAFTLALVSFSCTGPIIGTLLVEAFASGNTLNPLMGMLGFAIALAVPFALFAAFPGWLNSLPQSGGWLNSVKVSLGFIELALAFKFLSVVDLAYHWEILYREIFLAIWIIIFTLWGLYLIGKLKFAHDTELKHVTIPRLMLSILSFGFAMYLIPGLFGAPVKLMSGIAPPSFYKEWNQDDGGGEHCPHGLNCFHDYNEGMAYAKKVGKPVLLDFTGWSCTNCRLMEDNIWSKPNILKYLSEDYVLISLYVDDKQSLPEVKYSETTGRKMKLVGDVWSNMSIDRYKESTQPLYVLLDHHEQLLAKPRGYTPDSDEYEKFLKAGKGRYDLRKESGFKEIWKKNKESLADNN